MTTCKLLEAVPHLTLFRSHSNSHIQSFQNARQTTTGAMQVELHFPSWPIVDTGGCATWLDQKAQEMHLTFVWTGGLGSQWNNSPYLDLYRSLLRMLYNVMALHVIDQSLLECLAAPLRWKGHSSTSCLTFLFPFVFHGEPMTMFSPDFKFSLAHFHISVFNRLLHKYPPTSLFLQYEWKAMSQNVMHI